MPILDILIIEISNHFPFSNFYYYFLFSNNYFLLPVVEGSCRGSNPRKILENHRNGMNKKQSAGLCNPAYILHYTIRPLDFYFPLISIRYMTKKKSKKELPVTERHFGVILENIDSKIDLVAEGQETLDKKIGDFRKEVDERFDEVDYKFEIVCDELRLIRNELKEKIGRDEFLALEKRVILLEKKLSRGHV